MTQKRKVVGQIGSVSCPFGLPTLKTGAMHFLGGTKEYYAKISNKNASLFLKTNIIGIKDSSLLCVQLKFKENEFALITKKWRVNSSVSEPDPDWIRIQSGPWIRIRNPDPGRQK